jgi:hypothetical protein
MTTNNDAAQPGVAPVGDRTESMKPITIMLPDDISKRLKVIAILRETSVSELVADAAAGVVRKELKKALAKLAE